MKTRVWWSEHLFFCPAWTSTRWVDLRSLVVFVRYLGMQRPGQFHPACFEIPRLPLTIPYTCILGVFHYHLLQLTGDGRTFFNSYVRRRHGGSTNQRASAAANAHGAAHKSAFA